MKQIIIFLLTAFLANCYSQKQSNFDVSLYEGLDLLGKPIVLAELPLRRLAINVYAPTCIPCVKEIPALNYLFQEVNKDKLLGLYMVVDPYDIVPDAEPTSSFDELYPKAKAIMEKEVSEKKIDLPILIMKRPFRVSQGDGLITGRPETLLFKTKPLILFYNFIGPISEEKELNLIQTENKVKFFKLMLGGA
ncbi:MAG: TlpA family protein disulfide reductase [Leptospiraceae bacterium]|nr:TlpA family protein disulfide reductase [Leptospiraceae bacterium]